MSDPYIGQIFLFAGNYAPRNWMLCSGQLLAIASNQALFSILGTTYGGNGVTTFGLPDLRGAALVSAGQAPGRSGYTLGQTGGTERASLNVSQLASHTHAITASSIVINVNDGRADATSPNGAVPAQNAETSLYKATSDGTKMSPKAIAASFTIGASGQGQPVPTQMPYLALSYCICVQGLYPSRN